jgi:LmbE family N-acetylglucosaminyl deacetylase
MKILAIGPHPDDVEYGCWGLLSSVHAESVEIVIVTGTSSSDRAKEAQASAKTINANIQFLHRKDGSVQIDSQLIDDITELSSEYDLVLAPHPEDTHQDHRSVSEATLSALRRRHTSLAYYATPSTLHGFNPNTYLDLTPDLVAARAKALGCHKSQLHNQYFTKEHLLAKDTWWGYRCGYGRAEAYQLARFSF